MFEKILVAHDGSDGTQRAFETALDLPLLLDADLYMVSVEENLPHLEGRLKMSPASPHAVSWW